MKLNNRGALHFPESVSIWTYQNSYLKPSSWTGKVRSQCDQYTMNRFPLGAYNAMTMGILVKISQRMASNPSRPNKRREGWQRMRALLKSEVKGSLDWDPSSSKERVIEGEAHLAVTIMGSWQRRGRKITVRGRLKPRRLKRVVRNQRKERSKS